MANDYKIGTSVGGMVTLSSLSINDPQIIPVQYSSYIPLGDGTVKGCGWLRAEWHWPFFRQAWLQALRIYMPLTSGTVYIKTINSGGGFDVYSAIYVWPQTEQAEVNDIYTDWTILFQCMARAAT